MSRRRFFVLDEPCQGTEVKSMMCRVVTDKLRPLQQYAPAEPISTASSAAPPHSPAHLIPDILPAPSLSTNRKLLLSTIKDNQLRTSLTTIFSLDLARSNEEKLTLESEEVKRYSLSNPGEYFDVLMKNEHYAKDVQDLLETTKRGRAYLVTGFLTTKGTTWNRSHTQQRTTGFSASVPVSALTQVPLPGLLDPSIEPSSTTGYGQEDTMHTADEEIFAVAYSLVTMSRKFSSTGSGLRGKKVVAIGPSKRAKAKHLALGSYSDEDSDSQDDTSDPGIMLLDDAEEEVGDRQFFELGDLQ